MIVFDDLERRGRLGNQCWQIASTIGLANDRFEDCAFPPSWSYRPFFQVPDRYFAGVDGTHPRELVTDVDVRHRDYLQDFSYWSDYEKEIREFFTPSARAKDDLFSPDLDWFHRLPDKISLHVRRGDNVISGPEYYPLPTLGYYRRALERFPKDSPIVVFSDEIPWCREVLAPALLADREHYFFEGVPRPKEHEAHYLTAPVLDWIDLQAMSLCSYHAISNSTFAFWGAFLSFDQAPIYPDRWYGPLIRAYANPELMFTDPRWQKVGVDPE